MTCYYTKKDCYRMAENQLEKEEDNGEKPKETAQQRADRIWKLVELASRDTWVVGQFEK